MGALTLELPWPPTSNNLFPASKAGRRHLSVAGQRYRRSVRDCVLLQLGRPKTIHGHLRITTHLYPPDRRRRDEDNYHKAPRDALTWCGVIHDDCQFKQAITYMHEPVRRGKVILTIERLCDLESTA